MDLLLGWSLDPQLPDAMRCTAVPAWLYGESALCLASTSTHALYCQRGFQRKPVQSVATEDRHEFIAHLSCRPQMAATFLSLKPVWEEEAPFAAQLVQNLVRDMQAVTCGPGQATVAQLRRFLALCNCIAAFAKSCGSSIASPIAGVLTRLQSRRHCAARPPERLPT